MESLHQPNIVSTVCLSNLLLHMQSALAWRHVAPKKLELDADIAAGSASPVLVVTVYKMLLSPGSPNLVGTECQAFVESLHVLCCGSALCLIQQLCFAAGFSKAAGAGC